MNPECALYAPVIALVVSVLKRVPVIGRHPKLLAMVIVLGLNLAGLRGALDGAGPVSVLVVCLIEQMGLTVGAYEILKPLLRALRLDAKPRQVRRATDR